MICRVVLRWVMVALLLALATSPSAGAASRAPLVSPELEQALQTLAPGDTLPVIVTLREQAALNGTPAARGARVRDVVQRLQRHAADRQAGLVAALRRVPGVTRVESFWVFNGLAVTATGPVIRAIADRPGVASVALDATFAGPAAAATPAAAVPAEPGLTLIGAPTLWDLGLTGQGVTVAALDTGADATHPDLAARWRGGASGWFDPNGEHPSTPTDVSGHGTQMLGVMVGGSAGGTAIGVAPQARWIAAKIFNDRGLATVSGVHQAFQWVLDPDRNPATADAPNVVNASWTTLSPGCDLTFQLDLRSLRAAGILPVFAAGNSGPTASSGASPANNPEAFAVGATDFGDGLPDFSARGPSSCGEPATTFPELVAPGVGIRSADVFGGYRTDSGTSLAAAHASGVLALLAGAFPDSSADRQASALQLGAVDLRTPGPDNDTGSGRLDALGAYNWLRLAPDFSVSAAPASSRIAAGATTTYTVSVTARNGFSGDVALSFAGLTAAQGTATIAPSTVAGGTGTATVSVTTAASIAPGTYPLRITGTSGGLSRTATVTLDIIGPPDFTLSTIPAAASVTPGGSATFTVSLGALNGFTGPVTLSATGLPTGGRATFTPNPLAAPGTGSLTLATSGASRRATYTVTVAGVKGTLRHTTTITLTVR
jgi:subtilisin family serine protease